MSKKIKVVAGMILIFTSVILMIGWEAYGRSALLEEKVIAAARSISAGEICDAEDFVIKSVPRDSIIGDGLTPDNINDYLGKTFKHDLSANSQIPVNSFISGENIFPEGASIFQLKKEWLINVSNSLRKGDHIEVYMVDNQNQRSFMGEFYVAFVKDDSGREVIETTGFSEPRILSRTNGLSIPAQVEIAATLEEYTAIYNGVTSGGQLILLQKGVSIYE